MTAMRLLLIVCAHSCLLASALADEAQVVRVDSEVEKSEDEQAQRDQQNRRGHGDGTPPNGVHPACQDARQYFVDLILHEDWPGTGRRVPWKFVAVCGSADSRRAM